MRNFIIIISLFLNAVVATAQTNTVGRSIRLDDKTIVKDSSGMLYPYAIWQKLMQSGEYTIKPINLKADNPEFIICKLSEKEKLHIDSLRTVRNANAPKPAESKFFITGKKIQSFKEKDMDGNKFSLKDLTGKIIVLNFWFVGCPPCRAEIPELNKVVEKYKDNSNVVFIAVALDDAAAIKGFIKTTPFNYHIIDNGRYIAQGIYSINSYPTHAIIDGTGVVRFHTTGLGLGTVSWIQKTIDTLLTETK